LTTLASAVPEIFQGVWNSRMCHVAERFKPPSRVHQRYRQTDDRQTRDRRTCDSKDPNVT